MQTDFKSNETEKYQCENIFNPFKEMSLFLWFHENDELWYPEIKNTATIETSCEMDGWSAQQKYIHNVTNDQADMQALLKRFALKQKWG